MRFAAMTESSDPPAVDGLLDGAVERIRKYIFWGSVAGLIFCLARYRWPVAIGFALGAAVSYINHGWLGSVVNALGERITTGESRERGGLLVFRILLRYGFVTLGAYVIFKLSLAALYGFLGGICLTIAALACEVAVELFALLRH